MLKVTRDIQFIIYKAVQAKSSEAVQAKSSKEYWGAKRDVQQDNISEVDWMNIRKAMRSQPRTCRIFISKHVSGMCGVGKFMHRWGEWEALNCPRCGLFEDASHVWLCKGPGTKEIWTEAVSNLERLMRQLNTDPTLMPIIVTYLEGWWNGHAITYVAPREFQELLKAQSRLGWGRFFEGWFVKQWAEHQQRYYKVIKASRTG
jgi:hypothetical protein